MQSREDGVAAAALSSRLKARNPGRVSRLRALSEMAAGLPRRRRKTSLFVASGDSES